MDQFDEYQKLMRYKYGYQSFFVTIVLSIVNFNLDLFFDIQWAETKSLEFMLIIFISIGYSIVMNVYKGAYFAKHQNPVRFTAVFFILGIANIIISSSPHSPLISDGLITLNSVVVVYGLIWTAVPLAYLTRMLVDKRRELKDSEEKEEHYD